MSKIQTVTEVKVGINFGEDLIKVGRLAIRDRKIYFEYDREFLERKLEISPIRLPLQTGLATFEPTLFEGLPGVFNDSLPDGWGRLLFDRFARSQGVLPFDVTPLDRLAHIGHNGLGALIYEPDHSIDNDTNSVSLDELAEQAREVMSGESDEVLEELLSLNGSSAGARPKALIGVNDARDKIIHGANELPHEYQPWMVKFPNTQDGIDAGAIEYVYALMAKRAGIDMPETHLFPAQNGPGFFATKRFDRDGSTKYHMHTACGLLHSDFRTPSLDYEDLLTLTGGLTKDIREVEKMYQLAVFNVLSHNRDDHSKNFTFLMDNSGQWKLSPAYDLTFSSGPGGEQSTSVLGEGRSPSTEHLAQLGEEADIPKARVTEIIERTKDSLSKWPEIAKNYGVMDANIKLIEERMC